MLNSYYSSNKSNINASSFPVCRKVDINRASVKYFITADHNKKYHKCSANELFRIKIL